jgi:hypothetical protein
MDYEKPEAVSPQMIYQHAGHQSPQPDGEATLNAFDEPAIPEERREFRGDSLWYGFRPTASQLRKAVLYRC